MKSRRGKRIAWCLTGVGLLVLLACAVAFKDRAVEQYWLWKLESEDIEEQKAAAEKLAEMRAVRAVPTILNRLSVTSRVSTQGLSLYDTAHRRLADGNAGKGLLAAQWANDNIVKIYDSSRFLIDALLRISEAEGRATVPYLVRALQHEDGYVRYLSAAVLARIGPLASDTAPALITAFRRCESGREWQSEARGEILWALGQIGRKETD